MDDIEVASAGDSCFRLASRSFHVASKASFASPWKDEIERRSDASSCCDSDCESSFNELVEHRNERASSLDRVSRRNRFNANATMPNPAPRFKWSVVKKKKAQKYHWSGTFNDRVKKYRSFGTTSDPNYNYNFDAFDEQKATKKTKLSHYNDLNMDEESSESNENAKRNGRRGETDTALKSTRKARASEERRNSVIKRDKASSYFLERCSPIDRSASFRLCNLLLSLVRNLILFSFLPTLYVAFFVYVERTSQHR